ncbi:hypothetical protein Glove_21g119 [Diversispora epigaea]|uniref:ribonuclease H n=1 Tax=Diversispora epigaea TaxID=1348612 RepID=A0A397JNC7_9GLOM|nr:hypothetical protein Glove_21g119 [Diversispora epigaea]
MEGNLKVLRRKYGVLYIEQLLNSDLTRVLELKRIHQYEIPRKNLTWYEELRVKIEENIDNIRNKLGPKHDIEIQINGKLEFPVIVRGGVIDIESFMGSDIWYHKHRDSLRKYGVLYIEQLLNSDLTRVLELKRIHQYEIPRKNLTWYEELRVKIEENIDNIRNKLGRNPINRLTLLGDNTKIKGKFVTTDYPSGPIMGKVTREPKEQSQQIILRHYIQENNEETSCSPLVACEGCPLKDSNIKYSNLNQSERDLQYCAISTNVTETSYLPTRKSAFSTSNREDKRRITRMVISPRSLNIYHNNIPKKAEFKNLRKNINDTDFLENIIITDPETSFQFQNIRTNLLRHKKLIVYTDGSLQKTKSVDSEHNKVFYQYKMDDPILRQFTWKGNIEGPASSTRAELWGILSVLWVASHKTSITIFTDSESSIKAIKGYIEGKKGKHWSNYSNPHVLQVIKEIINTKELNIVLEKVEAHKGDLLNEQANKLAKLGVNSENNNVTLYGINKKSTLELKNSLKRKMRLNKQQHETWHETKITNNKTNSKENSLRAFSLKLLNEELPTIATLHTRKPNIYTTTECPFCKKYKETNSHIFMCADYGKILKFTFRSIIKRIYIKEKGNIGLHDLMSKITRGHFLKINYHRQILGTQPSDRFEFNDLVKGLIPKSIYRLIRKKVNSTETGKNMVMEIFCSWKRTLYSCWKNRCKDFLNWEIKNDISESDKKSKGKKPYIDYTYLERKKHLYDIGIDIKNFIINSVYKNNVDILSNIFFCLDVGGVVASHRDLTGPVKLQSIHYEYGPTEPYRVIKGVDQEIENLKKGYEMELKWKVDMSLQEQIWEKKMITSMAYMDDTVWITSNKAQLEDILSMVEDFFNLNKIKVNASKSDLILINGGKHDPQPGISFMGDQITPAKPNNAIRYLGVWIQGNGKKSYQKKLIEDKIKTTTSIMIRKSLTDKQKNELNKLNARIRMTFKWALDTCENYQQEQFWKNFVRIPSRMGGKEVDHEKLTLNTFMIRAGDRFPIKTNFVFAGRNFVSLK